MYTPVNPLLLIKVGCKGVFVTRTCFHDVFCFQARNCAARGDMAGAHAAAESARQWTRISIAVGVVSFVILGVCIGVLRALHPQVTYHR